MDANNLYCSPAPKPINYTTTLMSNDNFFYNKNLSLEKIITYLLTKTIN